MVKNLEKQMLKILDNYMDDVADKIFSKSQQRLIDDGKVDTGTLLKTGNVIRKKLHKTIVYPASYADQIEFGRDPGTYPNVDSLKVWVRRKLGISNPKEASSVAWAIATSIKKRGMQPSPFLQPSIESTKLEGVKI